MSLVESDVPPPPLSRDQVRSRRRHPVGARCESEVLMSKRRLAILTEETARLERDEPLDARMPRTRDDCIDGARPCPWVSCKHHLYLDVTDAGSLKLNFPDVDVSEMDQLPLTCALDGAARGEMTLEEIGAAMNLTRERVRQVEVKALAKLARFADPELDE